MFNFDASTSQNKPQSLYSHYTAAFVEADKPQHVLAISSQTWLVSILLCQAAADQSTVAPQTLRSKKQMQPLRKVREWLSQCLIPDSKLGFFISAGVSFPLRDRNDVWYSFHASLLAWIVKRTWKVLKCWILKWWVSFSVTRCVCRDFCAREVVVKQAVALGQLYSGGPLRCVSLMKLFGESKTFSKTGGISFVLESSRWFQESFVKIWCKEWNFRRDCGPDIERSGSSHWRFSQGAMKLAAGLLSFPWTLAATGFSAIQPWVQNISHGLSSTTCNVGWVGEQGWTVKSCTYAFFLHISCWNEIVSCICTHLRFRKSEQHQLGDFWPSKWKLLKLPNSKQKKKTKKNCLKSTRSALEFVILF